MKFNIGWGLTNTCNMKCEFCYSKKTRKEIEECNINDWIDFVSKNHENIDSINYGTGENSLFDDFYVFVDYVRKNYPNIKQSITTNGYISQAIKNSKEKFEIFKNSIDEIDVSIDFNDKVKHGIFRGNPFVYDWAIETLKISKELGKLTTIVFAGFEETLAKENIDGLFSLAKEYSTLVRMNIYRPVSINPSINQRFILSYKTLINALEYINEKYQIVSLSDVLLGTVFAGKNDLKDNTGISSLRILPDGSICPSTYLITEEYRKDYNIKQGKILDNLKFKNFNNVLPKECNGCKYQSSCAGGVLDRRILWYGTLEERDPYCPIRLGEELPKTFFKTTKTDRVSVHDDYLPTLFFKNKGD